MKSNKDIVLDFIKKYFNSFNGDDLKGISTLYLSNKLGMQRTNLSSILNELAKEGQIEKSLGRPVLYRMPMASMPRIKSCFNKLIGHDESLKGVVQLAKAAILYPHKSLDTLIVGPCGSGKSYFARLMYEYAIEHSILKDEAPYIKLNCRNYEDEKNMIDQILFHGIFDKEPLLKQAENGVLLIDFIDQLSPYTRDKLFKYIEELKQQNKQLILLCSMDDNVAPSTLKSFQRNLSVQITMPSLEARDKAERFKLVQHFLTSEAVKMNRNIKINSELLRCLLLYSCDANIKQLKNDIVIGCATAYVRQSASTNTSMMLFITDFPSYVRKGFLHYKENREEIEKLIPENYSYTFSSENIGQLVTLKQKGINTTIYEAIDHKTMELRNRGIAEEDINTIVSADIGNEFENYVKSLLTFDVDMSKLSKIVDKRIIVIVKELLEEASHQFQRVYPVAVYYGLCLHLNSTLERKHKKQCLSNEQITEIIAVHKDEYSLCLKYSLKLEQTFNIRLPIDEVVFITMFVYGKTISMQKEKKPNIVIAMHGNSSASSIADVVNTLVEGHNTYAFDLNLEMSTQDAYEKLKEIIIKANNGKGIILIYDMGSFKTMVEMIISETEIAIKMIEMPLTLLAIESARKATMDSSLERVYDSVMDSFEQSLEVMKQGYHRSAHSKVIITLCMSGTGAALQLKKYIEQCIDTTQVDVIPLAISNKESLLLEINNIKKNSSILCIVGTYDPEFYGIAFVPITTIFEAPLEELAKLVYAPSNSKRKFTMDTTIYEYLKEQLHGVDVDILSSYLIKIMQRLKNVDESLSEDQELGLCIHIACSINRNVLHELIPVHIHRDVIIKKYTSLVKDLKNILNDVENAFNIIFNDDDIACIISIIKKL